MAEENKKQDGAPKGVPSSEGKENKKSKEVIVNGRSLKISTKQSISICDMIRGKTVEDAIKMLEEVLVKKRVVKMNNRQVGHQKGKGVMAGRYPINACNEFLRLVKQLNANAIAQEVEPENKVIFCKADHASRPYRRMGQRFKRTHVLLKLEEKKLKGKK